MNPINFWLYDTNDYRNKSYIELANTSLKQTYIYTDPVSDDVLRNNIQKQTSYTTEYPRVLSDPSNDSFLVHCISNNNLKSNQKCFFVNGMRLLPAVVVTARPLFIQFVDLSGTLQSHRTFPFNLYLFTNKDATPVNPLLLMLKQKTLCQMRFLETPKIGQEISYLSETFEVTKKLPLDRYLVVNEYGTEIELYRTDFVMKKNVHREYMDLNGSFVYFGNNIIGLSVKRGHAEVGKVVYFKDASLILHNSRGFIEVSDVLLLPQTYQIKGASHSELGDLFEDSFKTWKKHFPDSNWQRYFKRAKIEEKIVKPRRRLVTSDLDDFNFLWSTTNGNKIPFKFTENDVCIGEKRESIRTDFDNADGLLMININGPGQRPDVEHYILFAKQLDDIFRNEFPNDFISIADVFYDCFREDVYSPSKLFLNELTFKFVMNRMLKLGFDRETEKDTKIITKLVISQYHLQPIMLINSENTVDKLIQEIDANVKLLEQIRGHEKLFNYKYFKDCLILLLKRKNELSKSDMNVFPVQTNNLLLSMEFYSQLLRCRRKYINAETSQEIYNYAKDFVSELRVFNDRKGQDWRWSQFLDEENKLNTPSLRARESQLQQLSFDKATDLVRYNYFWDTFNKIIWEDDDITFPVFERLQDKATEFISKIVRNEIAGGSVISVEEESNFGMFSVITVGALILAASWALN